MVADAEGVNLLIRYDAEGDLNMTDLRNYSKLYDENEVELVEKTFIPLSDNLKRKQFVNGTVELIDANLTFDPMRPYIDLGTQKKAPRKYIQKELNWFLSQDLSINGHVDDVEIWKQIAAKETGHVNSNYGWMVFSKENGDQYAHAVYQLKTNPNGRQSTCIYMRPTMQVEWNDRVHADHDFACTFATQHLIRNERLDYIVWQRSMDLIFGFVNDFAWHCYVYQKMLSELNMDSSIQIKPGRVLYHAGSAHIYERHFDLLRGVVDEYTTDGVKQLELNFAA